MKRRALRDEPLFFELNRRRAVRQGHLLPPLDVPDLDPAAALPQTLLRAPVADFPDLGELEVVQHFHRLSQLNYAVDEGLYPLGSCTMKYNPRVNERTARLAGFADLHPLQPDDQVQGALALMWELEQALKAITGMAGVTCAAAGAYGELTGILMIRKALEARRARRRVSPTRPQPATASFAGYQAVEPVARTGP
jgi:glycine dehydrogenase subunit 2